MKVIIVGTRTVTDLETIETAVRDSGFRVIEVVSGGARGVDQLGELWASRHRVSVCQFPENQKKQMADYADALVAIWDGKSNRTLDMIDRARKAGLKVHVHRIDLE